MLIAITCMTNSIKKMCVPWHQNEAGYTTALQAIAGAPVRNRVWLHLVHYITRDLHRRLGMLKQGVTIFTHLSDLNTEAQCGNLNPGNMQSRHTPQEPHTNQDGISSAFYHT